jgi:hypothetical protein
MLYFVVGSMMIETFSRLRGAEKDLLKVISMIACIRANGGEYPPLVMEKKETLVNRALSLE